MKVTIRLVLFSMILFSCTQPISDQKDGSNDTVINNSVNIIWKGSLSSHPDNPTLGWAYYNTTDKKSYIWDGDSWEIIAQDGVNGINGTDGKSIVWKGELSTSPVSPEINWAYYNIIDGNSYIWDGAKWNLLAKSGRDGASGILLWIGSLDSDPLTPSAGWAYYNTTDNKSYIWDGDSWEIFAQDGLNGINGSNGTDGVSILWKGSLSSHPLSPTINWAYYNTTDNKSYIWDGDSWEILVQSLGGTSIVIDITWKGSLSSAPSNPSVGWAYYNTSLGKSYIWDGASWNILSQDGVTPSGFLISWKGSLVTFPTTPISGWAYYNTVDKKSYIWDGDSWEILAQDGLNGSNETNLSRIQLLQNSTEISSFNFGNVLLNTNSEEIQFEIKNTGSEILYLSGTPKITISGVNNDEYIINQSSLSNSINVGSSSYFTVLFNPKATGYNRSAELSIECSDATKNPLKVYLYGNGAGPNIFLSSNINGVSYSNQISSVNLGTCGQNYSSKVFDFSVFNPNFQNTTLLLTGSPLVSISGANSDEFILDISLLKSYIPYGDYTNKFTIQFTPKSTGLKTANITIINNSTEKPVYSFTITGTGLVWDKRIDGGEGDGEDQVVDSLIDSSGNIYILGYGYEIVSTYSNKDWWIKKFSSSGVEDTANWNKKIDFSNSSNVPLSIAKDSSDNIYVSGASNIKKFNSSGVEDTVNWNKSFGGYIRVDNSNNAYLFSSNKIRKFNSTGVEDTTNWNKTLTGFTINDVKFDSSNNVYIAGYGSNLVNSFSSNDWWVKKFSSSGVEDTVNWDKKVDGGQSNDDKAHTIAIDSSNNIFIIGSGYDILTGYSRYSGWIKKYGSNGVEDMTWNKIISLPYSYLYPKIAIDSLNNVYITDWFNIKKFNSSGVEDLINWNKYDTSFYKISIVIDSSNNLYVSGYADKLVSSYSDDDWWIKKFNSLGIEQ